MIAIPERQIDGGGGEGLRTGGDIRILPDQLVVPLLAGTEGEVGDDFAASAAQLRLRLHATAWFGALDGGALLEDGIERRRLRGGCGEVAGQAGERQIGLAGRGGELVEGGDVAMPGSEGVERGLLLFDFGLQNVGRVGLSDVGELARGLSGIGRQGR